MQKITTFFMFSEGAAEAMNFYVSIFKNSRILSTMPGPDGKPMGGTFELEGQLFSAFDGGPDFTFSDGISQFVLCDTQEEIDHFYEKLSAGGEQQPAGWVKDKFGVSWQIVPPLLGELLSATDREKVERVMKALRTMTKLDIRQLVEAAAG